MKHMIEPFGCDPQNCNLNGNSVCKVYCFSLQYPHIPQYQWLIELPYYSRSKKKCFDIFALFSQNMLGKYS